MARRRKAAAPPRKATRKGASRSPKRAPSERKAPDGRGAAVRSITPFLWFNDNYAEAATFYVSLFPGSRIESTNPMGGTFVLAGQRLMGLNGGSMFRFSPAVSFFVVCRDQAEVDRLWDALADGGTPSRCGWIDDRFGLTWQIVPEAFVRMTADKDPRKVKAVFDAMLGMVKMDVAGLQRAYGSVR